MKNTNIRIHPRDDATNGWSRIRPNRVAAPTLTTDIRVDWVVVGAGFSGLSAARRLAETRPDDTIALIEAQQVGEGASGRNSGFAIDLPHNVGSSMAELQASRKYMNLARAGIDSLENLVTTHGIDCDWSRDGRFHAAASDRGIKDVLRPYAKELSALGEPFEWVVGEDLRRRLGTSYLKAAVFTPGGALMNPAALVQGLADTLPANVTLYENTAVERIEYGQPVRLRTKVGMVEAKGMVLAVNAFAGQFGAFGHRVMPFAAHATLSRPLTAAEHDAIGGPKPWGVTPANAFAGVTMRLTNDLRILIRQNIHYCPDMHQSASRRATVRRDHVEIFNNRFPQLRGVDMDFTWTGYLALSRNSAPGFGMMTDNTVACVCQNAVGIAKGTISGLLAADLISERDNPQIEHMQAMGEPAFVPPRPFLDLGIRARFAWEVARARQEK